MAFVFQKTEIKDLVIIKPHLYSDDRGTYKKYYEKSVFHQNGISCEFTESSDLYTQKGGLRGLHFQSKESQAKLIHVISGIIFDVAVDLRADSSDFGKVHTELMRDNEHKTLFIPEGFAHGFMALSDNTVFSYQCSGQYLPQYCGGIRWDDRQLNIPWPLEEFGIQEVIATEKDRNWPTFLDYKNKYSVV